MRTLVLHQAEGLSERGVSLSIGNDARPRPRLGWAARFAPSWRAPAVAGGALLRQGTMGGFVPGRLDAGRRVDPEIGYGLRTGARFVGTPRAGLLSSNYQRVYRLGYGLGLLDRDAPGVDVGFDLLRTLRSRSGDAAPGALVQGRVTS